MRRLFLLLPLLPAWGGLMPFPWTPIRPPGTPPTASTRIAFAQVPVQPSGPPLGVPFGPFGLWKRGQALPTKVAFTLSQSYTSPENVISLITSARAAGQKLILVLTGGPASQYSSDGAFDLAKWERRMDQYNTTPIREAIAAGVADGTVLGNSLMDEPENKKWGGVMTKALIDSMAAYAKRYFPTLPMGPSHGPNGYYLWQPNERYRVVDYVLNQYNWWVTKGDVGEWRDKVLAQAKRDGVGVVFSLNIIDGGEPASRHGGWSCPAGRGGHEPACRMTAAQIREWGKALGPKGCALLLWRYDDDAMTREDNVEAMRDVAAALARAPQRTCGDRGASG